MYKHFRHHGLKIGFQSDEKMGYRLVKTENLFAKVQPLEGNVGDNRYFTYVHYYSYIRTYVAHNS